MEIGQQRCYCLCYTALLLAYESWSRLDAVSVGESHHEIKNGNSLAIIIASEFTDCQQRSAS